MVLGRQLLSSSLHSKPLIPTKSEPVNANPMSSEIVKSSLIIIPIQSVLLIPNSVVGGVVSSTNTSNEACASLPASSTAVQSTLVVPNANIVSLSGVHIASRGEPVAFVAETVYDTIAPSGAVASATTGLSGTLIIGSLLIF